MPFVKAETQGLFTVQKHSFASATKLCMCMFKIVYLHSGIYVFTCSFIKINSEEAFEVSQYAKLKADGKFLLILYI